MKKLIYVICISVLLCIYVSSCADLTGDLVYDSFPYTTTTIYYGNYYSPFYRPTPPPPPRPIYRPAPPRRQAPPPPMPSRRPGNHGDFGGGHRR